MWELQQAGRLPRGCLSVTGKTVDEILQGSEVSNREVILPFAAPLMSRPASAAQAQSVRVVCVARLQARDLCVCVLVVVLCRQFQPSLDRDMNRDKTSRNAWVKKSPLSFR
uniref:hypothetical protein n=1 Tax=Variovorax boronicumulans TaxID=436515 RepID=UPI00214C7D4A